MLDIELIRKNPEKVKENNRQRGFSLDVDRLLQLDKQRREGLGALEQLRQERNQVASGKEKPSAEQIQKGRQLKESIVKIEAELEPINVEFNTLLRAMPNFSAEDVPIGSESEYKVVSEFGDKKTGGVDHLEIATKRDWIDFDRGTKVAGNKFYYLKGDLALLENALYQFTLDFLLKKDYKFMTVPHMVSSSVAAGAGFAPRTSEQSDEYYIEGEDLTMIATAEIPLTGYHKDEILDEGALPLTYCAYSPCYRKEAGAYGKHTRGLFRVHQFNKLEMYAFTLPENSQEMHEKLRETEEAVWQALGVPYRVINIASGDLGAAAAKKYDIEYWSPVDQTYRELTSCSNCTDYQTRNLNIKFRRTDGTVELAHSLNGTAVALARTLVAIMDNCQVDGKELLLPEVLRPYMGGREKI
jgi:seryl-tRNA synthetase